MSDHDGHGTSAIPENDGTLACRMEEWLMSTSFLMSLNTFAKRHAPMFEDVKGGEHPHAWFDAFREYETMVNDRVEAFLVSEGVSAEEAVAACRVAKAAGKTDYKFFEYLAAAVEYESFYSMMLDFKAGRRDVSQWWKFFMSD
uniref:Cilia- and flagella-associated protein 36 n=1 Tax=Pyrodinium bahamense TaxID=73915 RepID=A0A7S0A2M2_9DINO